MHFARIFAIAVLTFGALCFANPLPFNSISVSATAGARNAAFVNHTYHDMSHSQHINDLLRRQKDGLAPGRFFDHWPNIYNCRIPCYIEDFQNGADVQATNNMLWKAIYIRGILKDPAGYTDVFLKKFLINLGKYCGYGKINFAEFRRNAGDDYYLTAREMDTELCVIAALDEYAPEDGCDHCYVIESDAIKPWHKE